MATIAIKKETTEHVEVTFPLYYKFGETFVKLVSPDAFMSVEIESGWAKKATVIQASNHHYHVSMYYLNGEQISKHDFENALETALSSLVALPTLSNY